jgi:hypothetical protein
MLPVPTAIPSIANIIAQRLENCSTRFVTLSASSLRMDQPIRSLT